MLPNFRTTQGYPRAMTNLDDLLNIREASEITGVSEMTIRKYLGLTKPPRPSRLPNARKQVRPGEQIETWAIPLSDLHNAGLMKTKKTNPQATQANTPESLDSDTLARLTAENLQLKQAITILEQSNTDLRANLADLRLLLGRSIETSEAQEARKKRFWQK
jgi:hypothetical protein